MTRAGHLISFSAHTTRPLYPIADVNAKDVLGPLSLVLCPWSVVSCPKRQATGKRRWSWNNGQMTTDKGRLSHSPFTLHPSYFLSRVARRLLRATDLLQEL